MSVCTQITTQSWEAQEASRAQMVSQDSLPWLVCDIVGICRRIFQIPDDIATRISLTPHGRTVQEKYSISVQSSSKVKNSKISPIRKRHFLLLFLHPKQRSLFIKHILTRSTVLFTVLPVLRTSFASLSVNCPKGIKIFNFQTLITSFQSHLICS